MSTSVAVRIPRSRSKDEGESLGDDDGQTPSFGFDGVAQFANGQCRAKAVCVGQWTGARLTKLGLIISSDD